MTEPVFTWNIILTAIAIPALGYYLKRVYDKADQLNEMRFQNMMTKLEKYCRENERAHGEIRDRLYHHGHACCSDRDTRIVVND